jgi:hypothetical protein
LAAKQTDIHALHRNRRALAETVVMMSRAHESLLRSIDRRSEPIEASLREIAKANALLDDYAVIGVPTASPHQSGDGKSWQEAGQPPQESVGLQKDSGAAKRQLRDIPAFAA